MPLNTQLSNTVVNAQATALAALCNGGFIRVFNGTQPANANTAITSQVLGVTLAFGSPAFDGPTNGVLIANPITPGVAVQSITPTWARIYHNDMNTVIMDVSVGASNCNMILNSFTAGTTITCSSFIHTVSKSSLGN